MKKTNKLSSGRENSKNEAEVNELNEQKSKQENEKVDEVKGKRTRK